MARYWVYINDEVKGPYEIDQLIRLQGFSRRTMVSIDDYSGAAGKWISPSEIPELARIFQRADELHDAPAPPPRPAPKPKPKTPVRLTPVAPPVEDKKSIWSWLWMPLLGLLICGGLFQWNRTMHQKERAEQSGIAQALVETAPLPSTSEYSTIRQYLQSKQLPARWEFERTPSGLYNVMLSVTPDPTTGTRLYAFETNLQVQSVRGLNTAGIRLLAEGFSRPAPKAAAAPPKPAKSPGDFFPAAINDRRQAFEHGDFDSVWEMFSQRRKSEMQQGGIGASGFIRMQKMSYRPGAGLKQTILKTRTESESVRLVLLQQTQSRHPDIFIKQRWVWEDNAWRLDEEEKKIANVAEPAQPAPPADTSGTTQPASEDAPPASAKPIPKGLPGFSDTSGR